MKKIFILLLLGFAIKGNTQVNLQTGSATFGLPMFNWKDDRSRLNSVVELNYNSGNGLKVNGVSSNVGEGWNLIAGGSITRVQVGEPDDQVANDGNGTVGDINKYPAGYLYNPLSILQGCPNALTKYPIFGTANQVYKQHNTIAADREQDYFYFQFNGRGGIFVLDKNSFLGSGQTGGSAVSIGDSKLKISFQTDYATLSNQNVRTSIIAFNIQDENGLLYKFTKHNLTKVLRQDSYHTLGNGYSNQYGLYDNIPISAKPYVITGWYLEEIEDVLTHRKVTINYLNANRDINCQAGISVNYITNQDNKVTTNILHRFSIEQKPAIQNIVCPDGNVVTFNYSDRVRYDLPGDYPIKSVDISYNGRTVSRYLLNTAYFMLNTIGYPTTELQTHLARLCLKSVQKIGPDIKENENPYVFDYFMGSNVSDDVVPPPFWLLKDSWGYYCGNKLSAFLPQSDPNVQSFAKVYSPTTIDPLYNDLSTLRNEHLRALCFRNSNSPEFWWSDCINPGYAKNGLLKRIGYPSGGALNYEYQQNVAGIKNVGGVHVSNTSLSDGGYSTNTGNSMVSQYNYIDEDGSSSMELAELPDNVYANVMTTTHYAAEGSHYHIFAGCSYDYMYAGILSKDAVYSTSSEIDLKGNLAANLFNLVSSAAMGTMELIAGVTGPIGAAIDVAIIVVTEIVKIIIGCKDYNQDDYSTVWSNEPNYLINPAPIVYKRLEVVALDQVGVAQGKTVYDFTSPEDYPIWNTIGNQEYISFSSAQRAANWTYGLPKKVTVFDANNIAVKQTENIYDFTKAKRNTGLPSCKCFVRKLSSINNSSWTNLATGSTYTTTNTTDMVVAPYNIYSGRVELTDTYDRIFKHGDASKYVESKTHFDYNSNNYQVNKITATQSNGDKNVKEIYYPGDYSLPGVMQNLTANNLINIPIASYSSVIKNGSLSSMYTGASVINPSVISTGDIKPINKYVGRSLQPTSGYQFEMDNPFNYPNLKLTQSFIYNNSGDLAGIIDEGNRTVSNIYDYDGKFIIATVVNANPDLDKPCYTSFETPNLGGWNINGAINYNTSTAITGNKSLILDGTSISSPSLNSSKAYKASFWATGTVSVSGGTQVATAQGINGFTYYEYKIAAGTWMVTLSGNGNIDELRLYPDNARMHTTTYDAVIGKTSDCDENNRITYYEYDNLGRLRFLKDHNKHIVKMYEYNTKQNGQIGSATIVANSTIYARFSYENIYYDASGNVTGDAVVRFYADAGCTQPYIVNNLVVNFSRGTSCDNYCNSGGYQTAVTISGNSAVLSSILLVFQSSWEDQAGVDYVCSCTGSCDLLAGAGYVISN